jgi:hypothetical protein
VHNVAVRFLLVTVLTTVALALVAGTALAEHELEHSPQRIQEAQERVLPPGYTDESQVWVWGFDHAVGLYGFLGFCMQDGGYWYWGGDDWYYHYCS